MNYLPGLVSNCDPADLCLLSSWDYRSEPPAPDRPHLSFLKRILTISLEILTWVWLCTSVVLATQEAEAGGPPLRGQPGQKLVRICLKSK
jgi:hypothetical protein